MGYISKKLAKMIKDSRNQRIIYLKDYIEEKKIVESQISSVRSIDQLMEKGLDPLHAIYMHAQNFTSVLAEVLSELPIFKEFYDIFTSTKDEYFKSSPPMSPITSSYFTTWAFFDAQFGQDNETIGTCILDVSKELNISSELIDVIRFFQESRMEIYAHCGSKGPKVLFKELMTEKEHYCHVASGYLGEKGQLWFARIIPALENFDYGVIFTTPYILNSTRRSWLSFLNRTLPKTGFSDPNEALYCLMKYGLNRNYWHEYIVKAYNDSKYNAIYLSGIPDVKKSLPKNRPKN